MPRGSRAAAGAATAAGSSWHRLRVSPNELRVTDTLLNGQCFGWRALPRGVDDDPGVGPDLVGVLGNHIVLLRDLPDDVEFKLHSGGTSGGGGGGDPVSSLRAALSDYFHLGASLSALRSQWSKGDARLAQIAPCIPGMRVVRQDPTECLFSFLCSSNNHIGRITMMLSRLRERYGVKLGEVGGVDVYSFPTVDALAAASEDTLRELGFGYRAPFVVQSARRVVANGGAAWLENLRGSTLEEARAELVTLHGVGRKVADCIAVFSLDKTACVPCDTHVWRIACRDMDPTLAECKSLTPAVHERVNDLFVARFGTHAGWAHSLLFAAELPQFITRLPLALQAEMQLFRDDDKKAKAERKQAAGKLAAAPGGKQAAVASVAVKQPAVAAGKMAGTGAPTAVRQGGQAVAPPSRLPSSQQPARLSKRRAEDSATTAPVHAGAEKKERKCRVGRATPCDDASPHLPRASVAVKGTSSST
jgi:N-glycosylase/DNA lyase